MLPLIIVMLFASAYARPNGAPAAACQDMMPQHDADPSSDPNPYTLSAVAATCPGGGDCYEVTISGATFRGFFIQARYIADEPPSADQIPQGFFEIPDTDVAQHRDCDGDSPEDAVTHVMNDDKTSLTVFFNPDGADLEGMQIVATVVQEHGLFWYDIKFPL